MLLRLEIYPLKSAVFSFFPHSVGAFSMTKSLATFKTYSKSETNSKSWQLYLLAGIVANVAIWSSSLLFLKVKPLTYSSQYTVTLPTSGSTTNVNLPNIGVASYENSSPYAAITQDPRENYKLIAESEAVIKAAANQLNMPLDKFGKPKVKIVNNTTLMEFELKGASPEEAQNKSWAVYKALEANLTKLRSQEVAQRDASYQATLGSSQRKLEVAQKRLSEYKARSGLNSSDQVNQLSINIEQLRRQRAELTAQHKQASNRLVQLSTNLNLSAQQATDAFVLQSDQLFQQNLKDYSDASTVLVVSGSKFMPDHPAMISEEAKRDAAQTALITRSQALLGRPVGQATLQQFNLSNTNSGSARETLFKEVVTVQADQQGLKAQSQELDQQIAQLESRLKVMAQQESTLTALQRDLQISETVFSSTLARLDLGKSNVFASYPLIQILTEPSLPSNSAELNENFVLMGAALGSLFLTTGTVSLWLRKRKTGISRQERELETFKCQQKELVLP